MRAVKLHFILRKIHKNGAKKSNFEQKTADLRQIEVFFLDSQICCEQKIAFLSQLVRRSEKMEFSVL